MTIGFRLVLMFSYLQILTKHTACLIVFPLKLLSWFAMQMKSYFLWPVLLADKSCVHIKFTPWWSLKSHTDGMALSILTFYCPKRKTAVKIFCSIMSLCSSEPKTTTTPNRKIPTCHRDTTMEPLLVHKKWRFPPIMLIVAGSYNENHMEASLFLRVLKHAANFINENNLHRLTKLCRNSVMKCLCFPVCQASKWSSQLIITPQGSLKDLQKLSATLWKGVQNDSVL